MPLRRVTVTALVDQPGAADPHLLGKQWLRLLPGRF